MYSNKVLVAVLILLIFSSCSTEIINMDTARGQVRSYYESGTYSKEVERIINETINELAEKQLKKNSAVVFDVDDTVLSSYEYTSSIGFGYNYQSWKLWMLDERLTAIPQVKRLYDWLIAQNVHIIFVTGRRADECSATYNNLIKEGYAAFDTLICRSNFQVQMNVIDYKSSERKALTEDGYDIIACIGDQWSDLEGDHTGLKVKLPNYLYQID